MIYCPAVFLWKQDCTAASPESATAREVADISEKNTTQDLSPSSEHLLWFSLAFLHNISTPLSTLATLIEDIIPSLPPATANLLRSTMQNVLNSTSLQSKSLRGTFPSEVFNPVETVQQMTPLLQRILSPHSLHLFFSEAQFLIHGNSNALEQILINLALNTRNALRSLPENSGEALLTIEQVHGKCHISWRDTGPGISTKKWESIQKPFKKTSTQQTHGFGLRSIRFWWENSFQGELLLQRKPHWAIILQTNIASKNNAVY